MTVRSIFAMVLVAGIAIWCGLAGVSCNAGHDQEQTQTPDTLFRDAEYLSRHREVICTKLLAVLANSDESFGPQVTDNQGRDERIRAAQLLGELQYRPAIPLLIQHIELQPLFYADAQLPPLISVLAGYGDAAVPEVVSACLKEDYDNLAGRVSQGRSVYPLYRVISEGKTFDTARAYARGTAAAHPDDAELVRNVTVFLAQLDRLENSQKSGE